MARTAMTPTQLGSAGFNLSAAGTSLGVGANNGITVPNGVAGTIVVIKNGANAAVVTIKSNYSVDGLATPDKTVNIAANQIYAFDLPSVPFNDANGSVAIDVDVASVTAHAVIATV